jgi:hypothetical protein
MVMDAAGHAVTPELLNVGESTSSAAVVPDNNRFLVVWIDHDTQRLFTRAVNDDGSLELVTSKASPALPRELSKAVLHDDGLVLAAVEMNSFPPVLDWARIYALDDMGFRLLDTFQVGSSDRDAVFVSRHGSRLVLAYENPDWRIWIRREIGARRRAIRSASSHSLGLGDVLDAR